MFYIDDIVFKLILPERVTNYLNNRNINDIFITDGENYYLKENVSDEIKYRALDTCYGFLGQDVGQMVVDDEELLNEFNSLANIYYTDHYAKDLVKRGKVNVANELLKKRIKELQDFKNNIIQKENNRMLK